MTISPLRYSIRNRCPPARVQGQIRKEPHVTSASQCLVTGLAWAWLLAAGTAYATLPIQEWQTPNGARVLFVESLGLPMFRLAVDFPAGASRDLPARSGA